MHACNCIYIYARMYDRYRDRLVYVPCIWPILIAIAIAKIITTMQNFEKRMYIYTYTYMRIRSTSTSTSQQIPTLLRDRQNVRALKCYCN